MHQREKNMVDWDLEELYLEATLICNLNTRHLVKRKKSIDITRIYFNIWSCRCIKESKYGIFRHRKAIFIGHSHVIQENELDIRQR